KRRPRTRRRVREVIGLIILVRSPDARYSPCRSERKGAVGIVLPQFKRDGICCTTPPPLAIVRRHTPRRNVVKAEHEARKPESVRRRDTLQAPAVFAGDADRSTLRPNSSWAAKARPKVR